MASFASSATTGGARNHVWTKSLTPLEKQAGLSRATLKINYRLNIGWWQAEWLDGLRLVESDNYAHCGIPYGSLL